MNTMTVQGIKREGKRLTYSYTVSGEWKRYFQPGEPMWVEYDRPVDDVPESIAVLPLIGNVIVLASLMDAVIHVDEIDQDFYHSVPEFINGFITLFPDHVHFKRDGLISAKKLVSNPLQPDAQEENLLFFSGGVDATSSLITHLEEKPALVTIWGADIPWNQESAWKQAIRWNQEAADRYGLKLITIRSNFRRSLHDDNVNAYAMELVQQWWWLVFHHGVAMMCLAAPIARGRRQKLYLSGTYSSKDSKDWGSYILASDPLIDNHVRFCGCQVVHDGYEYSRLDKVERICRFGETQQVKPFLRVCYHSDTGRNCGHCAKCTHAILLITLAGGKPEEYGFDYDPEELPHNFAAGLQEMAREERYGFLSLYTYTQQAYRQKYKPEEVPPAMRVFYETDLEKIADFLCVPNNELIALQESIRAKQQNVSLLRKAARAAKRRLKALLH